MHGAFIGHPLGDCSAQSTTRTHDDIGSIRIKPPSTPLTDPLAHQIGAVDIDDNPARILPAL